MKSAGLKYFIMALVSILGIGLISLYMMRSKYSTAINSVATNPSLSEEVENELKIIKAAVANPSLINEKDDKGYTPVLSLLYISPYLRVLKKMSEDGILKMLNELLTQGANPNIKNNEGTVPLHLATAHAIRSEKIIKLLLDHGAQARVTDNDGWTPLHWAAEGGQGESFIRIVKMLLDHGADVNAASSSGNTPLMRAAGFKNNLPIIKLLLEHGADVNKQGNPGATALHESIYHGNEEIIKTLLDHGADVNAKIIGELDNGQTALHRAVAYPWENIVKLLLAYGADTTIKDAKGETALDVALAWAKTKGHDDEFSRVIALLEQQNKQK